jgi:hypothetical protein
LLAVSDYLVRKPVLSTALSQRVTAAQRAPSRRARKMAKTKKLSNPKKLEKQMTLTTVNIKIDGVKGER